MSAADRPQWAGRLVRWYRRHARPLTWRTTRDPYAIWVSEVMLQQTTVAVVEPYFDRFLQRFPSLQALSRAREDDVLGLWSGLGYYRRARQLLQAAKIIDECHGGIFPRDPSAARALPGVGRYTAGAVLSMAYDLPLPVVDGNVRRVLVRILGLAEPQDQSERILYEHATRLLPRRRCGEWNQALMELGAMRCAVADPQCPRCPAASSCKASESGNAAAWQPTPRPRRAPTGVAVTAVVVLENGRALLCRPQQARGPLARLWEIPHTGLDASHRGSPTSAILGRYGVRVRPQGPPLGTIRHSVTFRRLLIQVVRARLVDAPASSAEIRWVDPGADVRVATGGLTRKILALVPGTGDRDPR